MKQFISTKGLGIILVLTLTLTLFPFGFQNHTLISNNITRNIGSYLTPSWAQTQNLFTRSMSGSYVPQPASPEYLIISINDGWVASFAEWKTKKGVPTLCANVTWINANIGGTDTAERIWNYINQVYTTYPTLTWVLLIGDSDQLPPRYIYLPDTTEGWGFSNINKPTDFYYSVMDDANWDDDGDGRWGECVTHNIGGPAYDEIGDWQPDLYVGRIPFNDQGNITAILNNATRYARNPTSYSTTGWTNFLLAGAISNYDEENSAWNDGDYTDEAELKDWINSGFIPNYYNFYRFYENRNQFWDYSTSGFQDLNYTAVIDGIELYSPSLINLAGHGSPLQMWRKFDPDGYPFGERYMLPPMVGTVNCTGVAIGDGDNDGMNEIVVTFGPGAPANAPGTIWMYDGPQFQSLAAPGGLVWDLQNWPITNPSWPTCVDIGDVWNNGTFAIVVGTDQGEVIVFTWNIISGRWIPFLVSGPYPTDPVLCIEVGNADDQYFQGSGVPMVNVDIVWGTRLGNVKVATLTAAGGGGILWTGIVWVEPAAHAIYSIDVGDPDDDGLGEVTVGTGYNNATGLPDGDCFHLWYATPLPWNFKVVDIGVGAIVYGLDTGDAGNDGENKVVLGLGNGAILMYESGSSTYAGFAGGTDAGTKKIVAPNGANYGLVRSLRVGWVCDNPTTPLNNHYSIIVGHAMYGIQKYHADNVTGYIDDYPVEAASIPVTVTAIDVGELSYWYPESTSNQEIASGGDVMAIGQVWWFEWERGAVWDNQLLNLQVALSNATIPALVYSDACLTGAFDHATTTLAGEFIRNQAIGYIGALRISWYYLGPMANSISWGLNRYMDLAFWQLFFGGTTNYRPGQTLYTSKANYIASYQGSHSQSSWETYHRKNLLIYALFGDPEVDIFTNNPGTLTVTHPLGVPHNQNATFLVMNGSSPVSGATVCLWHKTGSYYQVATTNASGYAVFNVTAPGMSILDVTVTKHNFSPYETIIPVAYWITVSEPTLLYDSSNFLLDITTVTANCPNHGYLDDALAIQHTYSFYQDETNVTTGQLSWDSATSTWQALSVDCTTLPEGTYKVCCYFSDSDGIGWIDSTTTFTVVITTTNILDFLLDNWLILVIAAIIILVIVIIYLRRRRKS
jgi:hypothetical protein